MFAYIDGTIIDKKTDALIIKIASGLGFKVYATAKTLSENLIGEQVELHLYHQVKEDSEALFGFSNGDELAMFELLLTVSGVGPKSALNILSAANLDNLRQAIIMNNHTLLTKISGIGAKTAEKIVVELKSKLGSLALGTASVNNVSSDELDALVGLGYSLGLARQALGQVDVTVVGSAERIRAALKSLGK